jgi:hypothetical protein
MPTRIRWLAPWLGLALAASACSVTERSLRVVRGGWQRVFDRGEPHHQWFRFYPGPMRSDPQVAILCHAQRATNVVRIRREGDAHWHPARYERWHYPLCIEVLPGGYELAVEYYARETAQDGLSSVTTTTESTKPSVVHWAAAGGGRYALRVSRSPAQPAPGDGRGGYDVRPATRELWSTRFKLEVSHWDAEIERLDSWDALGLPIAEHREAWRRHEGG